MNMHTFSIIHNLRSRADRADRSLDGSLAVLAYFATASEYPKSKNEGCSEVPRSQEMHNNYHRHSPNLRTQIFGYGAEP